METVEKGGQVDDSYLSVCGAYHADEVTFVLCFPDEGTLLFEVGVDDEVESNRSDFFGLVPLIEIANSSDALVSQFMVREGSDVEERNRAILFSNCHQRVDWRKSDVQNTTG